MADEVEDEEPKKGGLIKIIIMVVAAILLIAVGLGIGYFIFGGEPEPDPSADDVVDRVINIRNALKKQYGQSKKAKKNYEFPISNSIKSLDNKITLFFRYLLVYSSTNFICFSCLNNILKFILLTFNKL